MRPTRAIIDLGKIRSNIMNLMSKTSKNTEFMAVVKANAYGHGITEVAKTAIKAGASFIGVAIPEEGAVLREAGINKPILVLGSISPEQAIISAEYGLVQTVSSVDSALILNETAQKLDKTIDIHIKLDTGMGRIGFKDNRQIESFIDIARSLKHLRINGVFTHFAEADCVDSEYTLQQLNLFNSMINYINSLNIYPKYIHAANSAAIVRFKESHYNMVRGGISMYGYYPSDCINNSHIEISPALKWLTQVVQVKDIKKGESISYGREYTADREVRVATLPVGYGDGYMRILSNKGEVLIHGKRAPIIGRICMDQLMVDISDIPNVNTGDEAVLLGEQKNDNISADEIAKKCSTISYEILTNINDRVPRIYING